MSALRAGPLGERIRTLAAWAAVALVAWQALASVREVGTELGRPIDEHLRVLRESPEELIRRKLGPDVEIWQALRSRVPREAKVLVSFANVRSGYREVRRRVTWLESLLYPLTLEGWPFDPERASRAPGKQARREYVLDLESGRDYSLWPCEELARGQHFRLLLVGSEAR